MEEIFEKLPVQQSTDLTAVYVVGGLLFVAIPIALILFLKRKEIGLEKTKEENKEGRQRLPSFVKNM